MTIPNESIDAKYSLLGSNDIPVIDPMCPFKTLGTELSMVFISLMPSSLPPAANMVPDLLKDKAWMGSVNLSIMDGNGGVRRRSSNDVSDVLLQFSNLFNLRDFLDVAIELGWLADWIRWMDGQVGV
ncbi:hypothetical protein L2E82_01144 [Cichorium intybus]|uniref:Uncharacterized protein n=1 Tax=Cichorium intybus TaxID=13427 RepID=A0ACB9GZ62_CICIN|nr:hypothetical protein L2E82_01144 [Cichorium intybus]